MMAIDSEVALKQGGLSSLITLALSMSKTEEREEKAGNGERQFFFVFHRYAASFYEFLFVIVTRCAIINHADWMFV